MNKRKEGDILFIEVLESLKGASGCPICEREADTINRYFEGLLHEHVNDRGVREGLVRARGFCHRHAHFLLSFSDGEGTAILYKDQVRLFIEFLDSLEGVRNTKTRTNLSREWDRHALCPACAFLLRTRDRLLRNLIEGLSKGEMREAFNSSPALCVPHFLESLRRAQDQDVSDFLIRNQREKLSDLFIEIGDFIGKQDYRFFHEDFGDESDSWSRAVKIMSGVKNLF